MRRGTAEQPPPTSYNEEIEPASEAAHAHGDDEAQARVGPPGGYLRLSNGAELNVPQGALEETVNVVMRVAPESHAFDRETTRTIGPSISIAPELVATSGQLKYSYPFGSVPNGFQQSDLAIMLEEPEAQQNDLVSATRTHWVTYPASIRGGRMVAELDRLPGMRTQFVVSR